LIKDLNVEESFRAALRDAVRRELTANVKDVLAFLGSLSKKNTPSGRYQQNKILASQLHLKTLSANLYRPN